MMTENGKIKQPAKMTHDYLFRVLLEDPGRAATLLREYLPPALSARMIDEPPKLLDGTYVDENSRMTQSDRLFEVRLTDGPPVMIYTLVEHKSVPEYSTPLQLLGYLVRIWTRYAEGKAAKLSALPVIVPLVFYHGRKSWTVPQTFGEMVQSDADTAAFVPSFRYDLHDLGVGPHQKLSSDAPVRAVLTALRYVQRNDEVTVGVLTALLRDLPDGTDCQKHLELSGLCTMAVVRFCFPPVVRLVEAVHAACSLTSLISVPSGSYMASFLGPWNTANWPFGYSCTRTRALT